MASIQKRGERFQLRVKHKLLPRPFFFTFDTEDEARTYGSQLEALLKRGIVPQELLVKPQPADDPLLTRVASDYSSQFPVTRCYVRRSPGTDDVTYPMNGEGERRRGA